jgi:hypothetical protein
MSKEKTIDEIIVEIEGCKQVVIYPPKDLIKYNYDKNKTKDAVTVDECIKKEIEQLWEKGIRTTGCCCGHGKRCGFIEVIDEDVEEMKKMGYLHYMYNNDPKRKDAFIPKAKCKQKKDKYITN